jgi:DNA polymerase I-like protein with 3'-5' exonuclease and polymerase domains
MRPYIKGGIRTHRDGKIRTTFSHNPSTLRLASQGPNLQNLPRPAKDKTALQNLIRDMIIAEPGTTFGARDFGGIEAVLVGYDAKDKDYIRLALRDVHSFYTAYALHQLDGRVTANDLPMLSWSDDRLFGRLAEIKNTFKEDRNSLYKHLVHAINFGQGATGAQEKIYKETDIIYPVKLIGQLMGIYKELFPSIPRWHNTVRLQAHNDKLLRNAFGYVHRFNAVYSYKRNPIGEWEKVLGDDAEAVLAFRPQSNAAGMMKEALLRLYFDRFEEAGQYLRLTIHDEIFWQCPPSKLEEVDKVVQEEMERPVPQLPLPASYGLGTHLVVLTEGKSGERWGSMH